MIGKRSSVEASVRREMEREREEGMNTGSFPIKMGGGLKAGRKTSTTDVSWFSRVS